MKNPQPMRWNVQDNTKMNDKVVFMHTCVA